VRNEGQKEEVWTQLWDKHDVIKEIQMWDFFGTRPWILKFTPRFGDVIEAGCGLGRYNFYLSKLGISMIGLDFSRKTINNLQEFSKKNGFNLPFIVGDVRKLPFKDNSLSGYLSFGVVEHFIEGPTEPLLEAFRVLRPGGIAIITTPNKSWLNRFGRLKARMKLLAKKVLRIAIKPIPFFQYEYSPKQLSKFLDDVGLYPTLVEGADFLFSFVQFKKYSYTNIYPCSKYVTCAQKLDNTFLKYFGAQSISVSVKVATKMHCFFCNGLAANISSLKYFTVPICTKCQSSELSKYYLISKKTYYNYSYQIQIQKPKITPQNVKCEYCGNIYIRNTIFENYGFKKNVCENCLSDKNINLELSNSSVLPIWRKRD